MFCSRDDSTSSDYKKADTGVHLKQQAVIVFLVT